MLFQEKHCARKNSKNGQKTFLKYEIFGLKKSCSGSVWEKKGSVGVGDDI